MNTDPKYIEISTWSDLKAIIDASEHHDPNIPDNMMGHSLRFAHDYADADDVNQRTVFVKQSEQVYYFTRIAYGTADFTEHDTYYAPYASRLCQSGVFTIITHIRGMSELGNRPFVSVDSEEANRLLTKIYKELRKMNLHLDSITDLNIKHSDLDGD